MKLANAVGKMVPMYLLDTALPQMYICLKKKNVLSVKHNKTGVPVFLGVLIHKSTHIRTQVRTVSVRMYGCSHVISFPETDPSVQTGTFLDFG